MTHLAPDQTDDKTKPDTHEQKPLETKKDDQSSASHDQKTEDKKV